MLSLPSSAAVRYGESIVDTVDAAIVVLDGGLRVRAANAAFYRLFSLREREAEGQLLHTLGGDRWNTSVLRTELARAQAKKDVVTFETSYTSKGVGRRILEVNAHPFADPGLDPGEGPSGHEATVPTASSPLGGTTDGLLLLVMDDVTERRHAESDVTRSNHELESFASVASHDLQEPLRKIRAYGELLATECLPTLGPTGVDYLQRITNAAERMQQLINDLLALSRVATVAPAPIPVDLTCVVRDVLIDLEVAQRTAGAIIAIDGLPTIEADPIQMRQLFQNLIGNALKFRRPDVPLQISVAGTVRQAPVESPPTDPFGHSDASTSPAALCVITVADNGMGLLTSTVSRFSARFNGSTRVPPTKAPASGLRSVAALSLAMAAL